MTNPATAKIIPLHQQAFAERGDTISIFIRDLDVLLRVGIYPHEEKAPQTVRVNVEMQMRLEHRFDARRADELKHSINYEVLNGYICNTLPAEPHIPLLETVGEMIIDHCLADERVQAVQVRLEKPAVLPQAKGAGIVMTRKR